MEIFSPVFSSCNIASFGIDIMLLIPWFDTDCWPLNDELLFLEPSSRLLDLFRELAS
jgi:hypothetical protein